MARTPEQVETDLSNQITQNFAPTNVDTSTGTVLNDVFIQPEASQISSLETTLDTVSSNQSIQNPEALSPDVLNGLAANVGLSRFNGTPSSGVLRFIKFTTPSQIFPIAAGVQAATNVTNGSDARAFATLSASQLTPTSPPDPITGAAAYVDVGAEALVSGSSGNV